MTEKSIKKAPKTRTKIKPIKKSGVIVGTCKGVSGRKPLAFNDDDRNRVESLSGYGLPVEQIAALTCGGIDIVTLYKYFRKEMIEGQAKANSAVGQSFFQRAKSGNDTAASIWWTKTRMRWHEVQKHEISGPDGDPIEFTKIERVIIQPKGDADD